MKCYYVHDKITGKVLIPQCMSVVQSNDIEDCICTSYPKTFAGFERQRYNEKVQELLNEISRLETALGNNN
tara:strand:- start:260 stop:472 length:213 start_codon:yes stop_codon:yes gene_type:complete